LNISKIFRGYSKINRYRTIIQTLLTYGFDDLVDRLNIENYLKLGKKFYSKRWKKENIASFSRPQRIRMVLEDLGPTFIKLGQILSMKPDIIPVSYIEEFKKLQDKATPFPFETAVEIIEKELDNSLDSIFSSFSEETIAAASIAQIYRAKTRDGKEVAVKVQRPSIKNIINADVDILYDIARLLESSIPESRQFNPISIVDEFSEAIKKEMDFVNEARNCMRFKQNFKGDNDVYFPAIFWDYTTSKVLTMEFIDGIKVSDTETLKKIKIDKKEIAIKCASAFLKQVFQHGFFHADPHPGNIFIIKKHVIVFLDYGMVGRLHDDTKDKLADMAAAVYSNDIDMIVKVGLNLGVIDEDINVREFKYDIADFIDQYYHLPMKQMNTSEIFQKAIYLFRKHNIMLPSDVVLLGKAFMTSEGFIRSFAPDIDLYELSRPYVKELMSERFSISKQLKKIRMILQETVELIEILPSEIRYLFLKIKKGDISVKFEHRGLDTLILEMEKSSNRLSFSLIIAALIIGSSLIIRTNVGPLLFGFPLLGLAGYLIAGILGLWLVYAILRSGKL